MCIYFLRKNLTFLFLIAGEGNIFFFFIEKSLKFSVAEAGTYSAYRTVIFALSKCNFNLVLIQKKYLLLFYVFDSQIN